MNLRMRAANSSPLSSWRKWPASLITLTTTCTFLFCTHFPTMHSRMQGGWGRPCAVTHAGDGLARHAGGLERQRAAVAGDKMARRGEAGDPHLQTLHVVDVFDQPDAPTAGRVKAPHGPFNLGVTLICFIFCFGKVATATPLGTT